VTTGQRVQIRSADAPDQDSGLVWHSANALDLPACGTRVRDWHGKQMLAVLVGIGEITCQRCDPSLVE
jgi:hypothetical protein